MKNKLLQFLLLLFLFPSICYGQGSDGAIEFFIWILIIVIVAIFFFTIKIVHTKLRKHNAAKLPIFLVSSVMIFISYHIGWREIIDEEFDAPVFPELSFLLLVLSLITLIMSVVKIIQDYYIKRNSKHID